MKNYDVLDRKLHEVYQERAQYVNEVRALYEYEWEKGVLPFDEIEAIDDEYRDRLRESDDILEYLMRLSEEKEAGELLLTLLNKFTPSPVVPVKCTRTQDRALLEQHSTPNLSRHLSSNAPPTLSTTAYSLSKHDYSRGNSPAYRKGNAHHLGL